jgi:hypothetical protein
MFRIFFLIITLKGVLMAIEEPKYNIIEKHPMFEIRKYDAYIVAQTEVSGTFDEMGSKAFKILFQYISGENIQRSKIKMTAPVIQEPSRQQGQTIKMTAPVIREIKSNSSNNTLFSFVMPQKYTLETLPVPLDKRVSLKEIPAKTIAVREYSGTWSEENYKINEKILMNALKKANIKIIGKTSFARYNSPFSLWFMRRNEVMVEIKR